MKKKYIAIVMVFVIILVFIINKSNDNILYNMGFLEVYGGEQTYFSGEDKETIKEKLVIYYEDDMKLFINYKFDNNNIYCIEKIYYSWYILKFFENNQYESNIKKLLFAADSYFNSGYMQAIDEVAYICLLKCFDDTLVNAKVDEFIERHIENDTGLLFENSKDDEVYEKLSFTIEVINIFKKAGIYIDMSNCKDITRCTLEDTEFSTPEDGNTLFNSGGFSIYATSIINENYNFKEYELWYQSWKNYYDNLEIKTWDNFFDVKSSYYPIATIFGDGEVVLEKLKQFITEDEIQGFAENYFDETMAYHSFSDIFYELPYDITSLFENAVLDRLDYYYNRFIETSTKINYYGIQLCDAVEYDTNLVVINNNLLHIEKLNDFLNNIDDYDLGEVIDEVYYSMLIGQIDDDIEDIEKTKVENKVIKKICSLVPSTYYTNPVMLRKLCECLSNYQINPNSEFRDYLRLFLEECKKDNTILSSGYVIDLYIIDRIMNFGLIDESNVICIINDLYINGEYRLEKTDLVGNMEVTYNVYRLHCLLDYASININISLEKYNDIFSLQMLYYYMVLKNINTY